MRAMLTNGPVSWMDALMRYSGIDMHAPWLAKLIALFVRPPDATENSATREVQRLFPHVDFKHLQLWDLVRIPLQLLALLFIRFEAFTETRSGQHPPRHWILYSSHVRWLRSLLRSLLAKFVWRGHLLARRSDHALRRIEQRGDPLVEAPVWQSPWARIPLICGLIMLAFLPITTPLEPAGQALFATAFLVLAFTVRRIPGRAVTLLLIAVSVLASMRYLWWRFAYTMNVDDPWALTWGSVLLAAEVYAGIALLLGYFQSAWPLQRKPAPLPAERELWPSVDVYVPTYNEPITVVAPTIIAALAIDWPCDKLNVYLLDDGRRAEMRRFAEEVGAHYIVRSENSHAKAGNLNHALRLTGGEYIAIFDCDHIPTSSFLTSTMGWFLRDRQLALVQTPHHFFSPDPLERNLHVFRRMPNEGELFHGLLQDGNDLWNATYFCGSCAVIRRGPLEEVGGIAVETVTEDAHTALRLQRRGYGTALINLPLAAGLATESLSAHIGQRIRWARGMAQIFRLDNPFFGPGLRFAQRICYGSAMLHFFNGGPRLVFLTAPIAFLVFHVYVIHASALEILLYVLPHLVHTTITGSRIQGRHRRTFWSDVYETVVAWYILLPTTLALINPRYGTFNVTAKGGVIESDRFDWRMSSPFLLLAGLNVICLGLGLWRLGTSPAEELGTTLLNIAWTGFNLLVLGAAIAAAAERAQRRVNHRAEIKVPITLLLANGPSFLGRTVNISSAGVELVHRGLPALRVGEEVKLRFPHDELETVFTGRIVAITPSYMSLAWAPMSRNAQAALVRCSIAQSGVWSDWTEGRRRDRPLRGLVEVLTVAGNGYRKLVRYAFNLFITPVAPALSLLGAVWRGFRTVLPYAPAMANQAGAITSARLLFNQEGGAVLLELPTRPRPVYTKVEF